MTREEARNEFNKALQRCCIRPSLKQYALDYFDDLCEYYDGKFFTEEDFAKMKINREEIEQDVVVDLVKPNGKVSAEEVFLYLFKKNVKYMDYEKDSDLTAGTFSIGYRTIIIQKPDIKRFVRGKSIAVNTNKPEGMTDKEWKKEKKRRQQDANQELKRLNREALEEAKGKRDQSIKHTLYHELSHVFECVTYKSREYLRCGLDLVLTKKGVSLCAYEEITDDVVEQAKEQWKQLKKRNYNKTFEETTEAIREFGLRSISEIFNELHSCEIGKTLSFKDYSFDEGYYSKSKLACDCGYNSDYHIATILRYAVGGLDSLDWRFKADVYISKMKELKIPEERQFEIGQRIAQKFNAVENANYEMVRTRAIVNSELAKNDTFNMFTILMGVGGATSAIDANIKAEIKACIQEMLIEIINTKVSEELNDENVVKDEKYFTYLNQMLKNIESVLYYPAKNENVCKYEVHNEQGQIIRTLKTLAEVYNAEEIAKMRPEAKQIVEFARLISTVRKASKRHGAEDVMTFFEEQKKIKKYRHDLEAEQMEIRMNREIERQRRIFKVMEDVRADHEGRTAERKESNTDNANQNNDDSVEASEWL